MGPNVRLGHCKLNLAFPLKTLEKPLEGIEHRNDIIQMMLWQDHSITLLKIVQSRGQRVWL